MFSDSHLLASLFSQPPLSPEQAYTLQAAGKDDLLSAVDCSISDVPALANRLSLLFCHEWLIDTPIAHNLLGTTYPSCISPNMLSLSCLNSPLDIHSSEILLTGPQTVDCQAPSPITSEMHKENIDPKPLQLLFQSSNEATNKSISFSRPVFSSAQSQNQLMLRLRRNAVFVSREYFEHVLSTSCQESDVNANTDDDQNESSSHSGYDSDNSSDAAEGALGSGKNSISSCSADQTTSKGYNYHINNVLYGWLERNRVNPYPTSRDKQWLMEQTGLTKMQLKNWFCNVRRRKLGKSIRRKASSSH